MTQRSTPPKSEDPASDAQQSTQPILARWFWGAIIILITVSFVLTVAAYIRQEPPDINTQSPRASDPEIPAEELDKLLTTANRVALSQVASKIDPLLDEAYKPVYDAIPHYADFHYSVLGEYIELSEAAFGNMSTKLLEILFYGLGPRLDDVAGELDRQFGAVFAESIVRGLDGLQAEYGSVGSLTQTSVEAAKSRMQFTLPVGSTLALGSAIALKGTASVVAKKIAAQLAAKAAAKFGGKWLFVTTTAGTGAALCAWTGPVAIVCATAGGVGAWLIVDHAIVKVDEFWTRDDFEKDLRKFIDEDKAKRRNILETAFARRAMAIQEVSDEIVRDHDFNLIDLAGGKDELCSIGTEITAQYLALSRNLRERQPKILSRYRKSLSTRESILSLRPLVQEIQQNLESGSTHLSIVGVTVRGNLPIEHRADKKTSARLTLNDQLLEFSSTTTSELSGFDFQAVSNIPVSIERTLAITLAVEQHLLLKSNPLFGGSAVHDVFELIGDAQGLDHSVSFAFSIEQDANASSLAQVNSRLLAGRAIEIELILQAKPFPILTNALPCEK